MLNHKEDKVKKQAQNIQKMRDTKKSDQIFEK